MHAAMERSRHNLQTQTVDHYIYSNHVQRYVHFANLNMNKKKAKIFYYFLYTPMNEQSAQHVNYNTPFRYKL